MTACFIYVYRWIPVADRANEEVNGASHTPHGPNDTAAGSDSTSLPITPHSPPTPLVDLLSDSQSGAEYLTDSEERKNLTAGWLVSFYYRMGNLIDGVFCLQGDFRYLR